MFPATTGYDLATGLGSPQLTGPGGTTGLAYYLCRDATDGTRPVVSRAASGDGQHRGRRDGDGSAAPGSSRAEVGCLPGPDRGVPAPARPSTWSAQGRSERPCPAKDTLPPDAPAPQDGAGPENVIVRATAPASAPSRHSMFEYVDTSHGGAIPSVTGRQSLRRLRDRAPGQVTILGSGFTGATEVTFGGVPRGRLEGAMGPNEITATPPAYSPRTACSPLPTQRGVQGRERQATTSARSGAGCEARTARATGKIRPPLEGAISTEPARRPGAAAGMRVRGSSPRRPSSTTSRPDGHLGLDLVRWSGRLASEPGAR